MTTVTRYELESLDLASRSATVCSTGLPSETPARLACPPPLSRPLIDRTTRIRREGSGKDSGDCFTITHSGPGRPSAMPQALPRWEAAWAVLPLWSILPGGETAGRVEVALPREETGLFLPECAAVPFDDAAFVCLYAGFLMERRTIQGVTIEVLAPGADALAVGAMLGERVWQALTARFGQPGLDRLVMSYEPQSPRLRLDKGLALILGRFAFCRFVPRHLAWSDSAGSADLADLVAHELTHIFTESTAPAGSWLSEGLTTYLARRILVDHGIVGKRHFGRWLRRARRNAGRNPQAGSISLRTAAARFADPTAANLVYNQGFLASAALDAILGGSLPDVARGLFQDHTAKGRPFDEQDFRAALPRAARDFHDRMVDEPGLPIPLPSDIPSR